MLGQWQHRVTVFDDTTGTGIIKSDCTGGYASVPQIGHNVTVGTNRYLVTAVEWEYIPGGNVETTVRVTRL
jgi:hypothetical protein